MIEWRPINTAPRDGTDILVCARDGRGRVEMAVVWWGSDSYGPAWFMTDDSQFTGPTHWMPLPEPPGSP